MHDVEILHFVLLKADKILFLDMSDALQTAYFGKGFQMLLAYNNPGHVQFLHLALGHK